MWGLTDFPLLVVYDLTCTVLILPVPECLPAKAGEAAVTAATTTAMRRLRTGGSLDGSRLAASEFSRLTWETSMRRSPALLRMR